MKPGVLSCVCWNDWSLRLALYIGRSTAGRRYRRCRPRRRGARSRHRVAVLRPAHVNPGLLLVALADRRHDLVQALLELGVPQIAVRLGQPHAALKRGVAGAEDVLRREERLRLAARGRVDRHLAAVGHEEVGVDRALEDRLVLVVEPAPVVALHLVDEEVLAGRGVRRRRAVAAMLGLRVGRVVRADEGEALEQRAVDRRARSRADGTSELGRQRIARYDAVDRARQGPRVVTPPGGCAGNAPRRGSCRTTVGTCPLRNPVSHHAGCSRTRRHKPPVRTGSAARAKCLGWPRCDGSR
jgi:hypothetical protein